MKKLLVVLFLLITSFVYSQENQIDMTASADYVSRYVFWGSLADKNPMQLSVSASTNNLTAKFWTSLGTENDVFISYNSNLLGVNVSPSLGIYSFTNDYYSEIALDVYLPLDQFTIGNRFAIVSGIYNTLYVRYESYKNNVLKTFTARSSWANKQFNKTMYLNEINTLSQLQVGIGAGYFVVDNLLVRGLLEIYKLDEKLYADKSVFNFSVGVQYYLKNPYKTEL